MGLGEFLIRRGLPNEAFIPRRRAKSAGYDVKVNFNQIMFILAVWGGGISVAGLFLVKEMCDRRK